MRPDEGALPPRTGSHRKRGRGRWITTDPGQYQSTTAPSGAECRRPDGANTRPTTLPPAGSPTPGGVVRAAARGVRPTIRTPGVRRCRHYGFVTTSQTPRSDAGPPIKERGTTPVVEFGLGFGRMDATTRAKDLRKMKRGATSLLLVAAVIFLCARWWEVNAGPAWIGYIRAMAEAGMVGGAGRLVRRHRALPPPAGAADPAHGDHPDEEGRARRQPRRLRRRELPGRGRRARQARPHRGGHAGRGVARPGGQRRPGHRRARDGRARRRHGAARRRRAGDHRAGPRPQAHGEAARPAAGHRAAGRARRRGAPPAGRPRLRPRLRLGQRQPGDGLADRPRAGAGLDPAVPRRHRRRQGVRGGAELRLGGEDRPGAPAPQGDRHVPRRVRHRPAERPRHDRTRRADQAPGAWGTPTCRSSSGRPGAP